MNKAVIYSRVSTTEEDYTSQTADLKRKAETMGYEVTHIYEEKESGFDDDRTELAKVLALTNADTDAVFVWEISRLSRRTVRPFGKSDAIKRDISEIENIAKAGPIAYADYYIFNNGTINDFHNRLDEILNNIKE